MSYEIHELALEHEAAFLKVAQDFAANDPESLGTFAEHDGTWTSAAFKKFVKQAERERQDWRPKGKAPSVSRYVMPAPDGEILALGLLRFPLDEKTELEGGNLVVTVPPAQRQSDAGAWCLSLLLFEAVRAGLRRALVTCPSNDLGARRMIERNRGELEEIVKVPKRGDVARYWIRFS